MNRRIVGCLTIVAAAGILSAAFSCTPYANQNTQKDTGHPIWTLDEAMAQLKIYPKDPFMQYVALQLARRENRIDEVAQQIEVGANDIARAATNERVGRVDLFSIFTGALAVQESLQLDAMRNQTARTPRAVRRVQPVPKAAPPRGPIDRAAEEKRLKEQMAAEERRLKQPVPLASLTGPSIKSHPWHEMLGDKKPPIGPLAQCVPDDFYYVEFRSLNKLIDAVDLGHLWSNYFFNQGTKEARTQLTGERLKTQLAVETNHLLRPFYDLVVGGVAVTGSDPFVNEGSDVTVVFQIKEPVTFKARMDQFLSRSEQSRPDATRTSGQYHGVDYVHVETPDRTIHVFSAYPRPDLHIRSNSLIGLEHVLDTIAGNRRRLGETEEFAYIRTLLPPGAPEEDGFIYLSDPFIRRLVGPELKLRERRRMLCYNHLRMIGHAALLYQAEQGHPPESLEALADAGCAPGVFGKGPLACPDGGEYRLSPDRLHGVCSHHGRDHFLKPCCEILLSQVTGAEADEYKAFLEQYNQYWRTFFDPIALRLQISPERYRLETIVLPLIDNSIYTGLSKVLGGKPEALDQLPVPKRNIFSVAARLNKEALLKQAGMEEEPAAAETPSTSAKRQTLTVQEIQCQNNLKQLGLALHNYDASYGKFPAVANFDKNGKPLLSWRVHLLPFLEQADLHQQFHLDEPWDSEHNKKLIPRMPSVFRCPSSKLKEPGKTTYLAPVGKSAMFTGTKQEIRISDVVDGTSNTILLVDAADDHAVTWTRPDDWQFNPEKPLAGLVGHHPGAFVALFVDGSTHVFRDTTNPNTVRAMLTRNGGEVFQPPAELGGSRTAVQPFAGVPQDIADRLKLKELLWRGIGDQVSLHVYDNVQLFDFNLPAALGMAVGTFNGSNMFFGSELEISFLAASLNSPVYIAIPVRDAKIVDDFLARLDALIVETHREQQSGLMFGIDTDFYSSEDADKAIRTFAIRYGPVKLRLFWARIGDGLYVASKRFILEDLVASQSAPSKNGGPPAHALLRVRAKNWNQVLKDFRLGWAENNREACLNNLGPLASVTRALTAGTSRSQAPVAAKPIPAEVEGLLGAHLFCPDGGHYEASSDGKSVHCTVHGDGLRPRQPVAPANNSPPNRLLHDFTGMTVTLTFLEDGLHAVVTIDRK